MLSNKNMFAIPLCVLNSLLLLFIIIISIIMIITDTFNTMKNSNKIRTKKFFNNDKITFCYFRIYYYYYYCVRRNKSKPQYNPYSQVLRCNKSTSIYFISELKAK